VGDESANLKAKNTRIFKKQEAEKTD
jgi:hypothetical protein